MTRLLITGARGAFGPTMVRHFTSLSGFTVFTTDLSGDEGPGYFPCNLLDESSVRDLMKTASPEAVIHLAGTMSHDINVAHPINVQASLNLLNQVRDVCPSARVILTGSASEYGVVRPEDNPIKESRALAPVSVYGLTKSWQTMALSYFSAQGVDVLMARPFNLLGKGLAESLFGGRVQKQIDAYKAGKISKIQVGTLEAVRDYISFEQAARQYQAILEHGEVGGVYHVASGVPISMHELLKKLLEEAGLGLEVVEVSPVNSNRKGYDVPAIYADISATGRLLDRLSG
jgi:nucleoside-diphosphate-sugar epimerase